MCYFDGYKCSSCGHVSASCRSESYFDTLEFWGSPVHMETSVDYCENCGEEDPDGFTLPYGQELIDDGKWHKVYDCNDNCLECLEAGVFDECTQDVKMTEEEILEWLFEEMEISKEEIDGYFEKYEIAAQLQSA